VPLTLASRAPAARTLDEQFRERLAEFNPGEVPDEFGKVLGQREYALAVPTMPDSGSKPVLSSAASLAGDALRQKLETIAADIHRAGGAIPKVVSDMMALREKCVRHRDRLLQIQEFFETRSVLDPCDSSAVLAVADREAKRLGELGDEGLRATLRRARPTEQSVLSLDTLFGESGADGKMTVHVMNISPVPDAATVESGELALSDLTGADFPETGGLIPVFETATFGDGRRVAVTVMDFRQKYIFSNMVTHVVLGGELTTLSQCTRFARLGFPARAAVLGNIASRDIGSRAVDPESLIDLMQSTYTSNEESFKALYTIGNAPLGRARAPRYEESDVTIFPSFFVAAQVLKNALRTDRSITSSVSDPADSAMSPERSRGLVATHLCDTRKTLDELGLPVLTTMLNKTGRREQIVLTTTRSCWSGGTHSLELWQGMTSLQVLLAHWLLQKKGSRNTRREARRIGREIDTMLKERSSEENAAALYLSAECLWEDADCRRQVLRDADGREIRDPDGRPRHTGKWEFVFPVRVRFKDSVESFSVQLVN
jgi:hypothetical protein